MTTGPTARVSMPVSHAKALLRVWRAPADALTPLELRRAASAIHRVELAVKSVDRRQSARHAAHAAHAAHYPRPA